MKKINIFFGSGGSRGVWLAGFMKPLNDKKLKNKEYQINNAYAISAGNWGCIGLLFDEHDILCNYWKSYDEEDNKLFKFSENKKFLEPLYTWKKSTVDKFYDNFESIVKTKKRLFNCYSAVFNTKKLKNEWLSVDDKETNEIRNILFASSSMPFLFPTIEIDGNSYCDAGLFEYFLVKDFMDKHRDETNIILTVSDYPILMPKNCLHIIMPNEIKKNVNFMDSNNKRLNEAFDLSIKHGEEMLSTIDEFVKKNSIELKTKELISY